EETQERGIALIYGASGVGKSETAKWYLERAGEPRPLGWWPVVLVRCTGNEGTREALHANILASMEGAQFYPQKYEKKIDTIQSRIPDGGLIIFDEAHLLSSRRLDELRYFPDRLGIAIALMGNLTGYKELVDAKIGQIMRRVRGARVVVDMPTEGDVDALLSAWGIRGRAVREVAVMIGVQDGGLAFLADTAVVARKFAKAKGKAIDADIFKAAAISVGAWGDML
ncbi:MAG TPA: AAA family ATPase, partial [Verrucomicrobiota bacterium]|nr:AAA family ATPase [Verrucomicrobiota bacterium]